MKSNNFIFTKTALKQRPIYYVPKFKDMYISRSYRDNMVHQNTVIMFQKAKQFNSKSLCSNAFRFMLPQDTQQDNKWIKKHTLPSCKMSNNHNMSTRHASNRERSPCTCMEKPLWWALGHTREGRPNLVN